ncbi:MAG: membrane protein insertion efficiency factor YidD [Nitrospirae bacterium]|nr:membrane protein insertion efficiency factor YidD [Nitrospirota bacterium]
MREIIKKALLYAIALYRMVLSPILPAGCRFTPTCSAYSKEAIEKYGALKGILLSIKRILKCHPFHSGGYDPIK